MLRELRRQALGSKVRGGLEPQLAVRERLAERLARGWSNRGYGKRAAHGRLVQAERRHALGQGLNGIHAREDDPVVGMDVTQCSVEIGGILGLRDLDRGQRQHDGAEGRELLSKCPGLLWPTSEQDLA